MAPIFAGSLQTKKKGDLQSLASALNISTNGTRDEIQSRIKKYLDRNQSELEEDPHFSGLFDRRRKRKESVPPSRRSTADEHTIGRRVVPIEPVYESTPAKELADVSAFLKDPPLSPPESDETTSLNRRRITRSSVAAGTSRPLTPLSPSPNTTTIEDRDALDRNIIQHIPVARVSSFLQSTKRMQEAVAQSTSEMLFNTRAFLSNTRTIWSVSILAQFVYIYVSVVPWQFLHIPFSAVSAPTSPNMPPTVVSQPALSQSRAFVSVTIPYPPLATFESRMFWTILLHWFIPTVLIPVIAGVLISFRPLPSASSAPVVPSASREITRVVRRREEEKIDTQVQTGKPQPSSPFDPLTASIAQLAAQIGYTFPAVHGPFSLSSNPSALIQSVDILGFKWRVLSASIGVAFSFAEALSIAGSLTPVESFTQESPKQFGTVDTIESEVD